MLDSFTATDAQSISNISQNTSGSTDITGYTPEVGTKLFASVKEGDLPKVKDIITQFHLTNESLNQLKDENGNNALLLAAAQGKFEIIDYLIESCHVDISIVNNRGENALLVAAEFDQIAAVSSLLTKHKIDRDSKNNDGNNALLIAAAYGSIRVLNLLIALFKFDIKVVNSKKQGVFHACVQHGQVEAFEWLIQHYYSKQDKDFYNSALLLATVHGQNAMIDYLIQERGADKNSVTASQQNAVLVAVFHGQLHTLKHLMAHHDFDLTSKDVHGNNVVKTAVLSGQLAMLDYLVKELEQPLNYQTLVMTTKIGNVATRDRVIIHILSNYNYDYKIFNFSKSVLKRQPHQFPFIPEIEPAIQRVKQIFRAVFNEDEATVANILKKLDPLNRTVLFNCECYGRSLAEICVENQHTNLLTILFSHGLDTQALLSKNDEDDLESEIMRIHALIRLTEAKYDPLICQEIGHEEGASPFYERALELQQSFFHLEVEKESEDNQDDLSTNVTLKKALLEQLLSNFDLIDKKIIFNGLMDRALYAGPSDNPKDIVLAVTLTEKQKQELAKKTHQRKISYLADISNESSDDVRLFSKFLGDDLTFQRHEKGSGWRNINQYFVHVLSKMIKNKNVPPLEKGEAAIGAKPIQRTFDPLAFEDENKPTNVKTIALPNRRPAIVALPMALIGKPAHESSSTEIVTKNLLIAASHGDICETDRLIEILKGRNETSSISLESILDKDGYSILLLAAANGYIDYMSHLYNKYNFLNGKLNSTQQDVILVAIQHNQIEVIKRFFVDELISQKDAPHRDVEECCPVLTAIRFGHLNVLKYLIELGCTLNTIDTDGNNPLLMAAAYDRHEIIDYLFSLNVSKNVMNHDAFNALLVTAAWNSCKTFDYLVSQGFDKHYHTPDIQDALDVAVRYGNIQMIDHLIQQHRFLMTDSGLSLDKLKQLLINIINKMSQGEEYDNRLTSLEHLLFNYIDINLFQYEGFLHRLVEIIPKLEKTLQNAKSLADAIANHDQTATTSMIEKLTDKKNSPLPRWQMNGMNFGELSFKHNNANALVQLLCNGFSFHCLLSKSQENNLKHEAMQGYILLRLRSSSSLFYRVQKLNFRLKMQQIAHAFLGATIETDQRITVNEEFRAELLAYILQTMDNIDKEILLEGLQNGTLYVGSGKPEDLKNIVLSSTLSPEEKEQRHQKNKALCLVFQAELAPQSTQDLARFNHSLKQFTGVVSGLEARATAKPTEMFLYAIRKLKKEEAQESVKGKEKADKKLYK